MLVVPEQRQTTGPESRCVMCDVILTAQVCTVDENCDERIEYSGTRGMPDLPGNHEVTNIQLLAEL